MESLFKGTLQTVLLANMRPNLNQIREFFEVDALNALKESLKKEGNIEPIICRERDENGTKVFEIIAGERRYRAMMELGWVEIQVMVVEIDERLAFSWMLSENLQRENLSYLEEVKGISFSGDMMLQENPDYLKNFSESGPLERFSRVLSFSLKIEEKLREKQALNNEEDDFAPSYGKILEFFQELPKQYRLKSFLRNDLNLVRELDQEVSQKGMQYQLNRIQVSGWNKLKSVNLDAYLLLLTAAKAAETYYLENGFLENKQRRFRDISGSELYGTVNKTLKLKSNYEEKVLRENKPPLTQGQLVYLFSRLGMEPAAIATALNISGEDVNNFLLDSPFVTDIEQKVLAGKTPAVMWKETDYQFLLLWLVALESKTSDLERMVYLKWRTEVKDVWSNKKEDVRFLTNEPNLSMETVARLLYYFVKPNETTVDLITNSSVFPQTSILLNRKNIAYTPDSENTDPLLHYNRQEIGAWNWPFEIAVDWIFVHPPNEWLAQFPDPPAAMENLILGLLTKAFSRNVIFFVRPPLQKFKIIEAFWSQGWEVSQMIDFEGSYATPSKGDQTQLLADRKLMADTACILVLKKD